MIKFECKQLFITDDQDFGCTIEFKDTIENDDNDLTIEEQMNPPGKYLLIQRSYPEEEDDIDWYSIECSEIEIEFSQKDKMYVKLNRKAFEIYCSGVTIIVELNLSDKEYSKLNRILKTRFKDQVILLKA